jgi:hypothetical protein
LERLFETSNNLIAKGNCFVEFEAMIKHDSELVAAKPGGKVSVIQGSLDADSDLLQKVIANPVSMGIVDRLETVQINQRKRALLPIWVAASQEAV